MSRRRKMVEPPRRTLSRRLLDDHQATLMETSRRVYRLEVTVTETKVLLVDAPTEKAALAALTGSYGSHEAHGAVVIGGEGFKRRRRHVRCLGKIPQPLDDTPEAA